MGTKLLDKRFWSYQWLVVRTAGSLFSKHFEGWRKLIEPVVVGLLSIAALSVFSGKGIGADWIAVLISAVGGPLLYILIIFLINLIVAPFSIYKDYVSKLSAEYIAVEPYYPRRTDVRRTEIMIRNEKDFEIRNCRLSLVALQVNRTLTNFGLPFELAWVRNNGLVWDPIDLDRGESCTVAFQAQDKPPTGILVHAVSLDGGEAPDYGPSAGIECGGKLGIAIYRDLQYQVSFTLRFTIDGNEVVSQPYLFRLSYDGEDMLLKRIC